MSQSNEHQRKKIVANIIEKWRDKDGPLLPILLEIKQELKEVPYEAMNEAAQELNISKAEVYGVYSFYEDFHRDNSRSVQIKVCTAEACQAVGCRTLVEEIEAKLKIKINKPSDENESLSFQSAYCLGNCALGPSAMINDKVYGRVSYDKINSIISKLNL